jgi:pyruvate,water dikinase
MERYGHRSPDEFDLACARFRESPERVLKALLQPASPPVTSLTLAAWLTLPIWLVAEYHLRANDLLCHRLMYVFASIRASLLQLADLAVGRGQLPDRDAVWLLEIDEVKRLDDGWIPDAGLFKQRRRSGGKP